MNLNNVSLPSKEQWKKVLTAAIFSFVASFLAAFTAAGGIQSTQEATVTLILASLTSAINSTTYALYITLFVSTKE